MSQNVSAAAELTLEGQPDSTQYVIDGISFAHLYGEPLFLIPTYLYIPPNALEVFPEEFEGPLNILLYLIRKQNFNILDMPMAHITLQYLKYVDQIRITKLELAKEYLLMAAMLIEIKSRMLLPVRKIDALPQLGRDYVRTQIYIEQNIVTRWPDVNVNDLQAA